MLAPPFHKESTSGVEFFFPMAMKEKLTIAILKYFKTTTEDDGVINERALITQLIIKTLIATRR